MNAKQILNMQLSAYPGPGQNARRKTYPLHDNQAIAAGTNEYFFFETALGNQFLRNKRFPLASTEIFTITAVSGFIQVLKNTAAEIDALNELLQQCYLEIYNNNRLICKLPGLDFINYEIANSITDQVPATANLTRIGGNLNSDGFLGRKFSMPIVFVGNSSFKFRFVTTTAVATAFDGINLKLYLHGVQTDKLGNFDYNNLKNNQFQEIPVTFYETRAITTGNETTYDLFQEGVANNLQSVFFPLSDIDAFSLEAFEFFVNQPDVQVVPDTIYNSSCLLYTSPSPRDRTRSRMPSSA